MGTYFRRPNEQLGSVGTTRLIVITTGAAQLVTMTSGFSALNVMNDGPAPVSWGDSSLTMGSGNVIFAYAQYEFLNVSDGWNAYFRADSAATTIAVTEFRH